MRRIISLVLCSLILLLFCGCNMENSEPDPSIVQTSAPEQSEKTVETESMTETVQLQESEASEEMEVPVAETEVRSNSPEETVMADIMPFGNGPGTIVRKSEDLDFPQLAIDERYKRILFESEHFSFQAKYKTYLVDGYIENFEALYDAIEQVTALTFIPRVSKQQVDSHSEMKITVILSRTDGNAHEDNDVGVAYTDTESRLIGIGQTDAFLGIDYQTIACLANILQTDNANIAFNEIYDYGFQVYTAYKVLKYLEEENPQLASKFVNSNNLVLNTYIFDHKTLYGKPLTYWMEQGYPNDISNGSMAVGFWFMMYLDQVYGDYSAWIPAYKNQYGASRSQSTDNLENQIQIMKDTYEESVLDGFYPWLKENMRKLNRNSDYSWTKELTHYPIFNYAGYFDLFINGKYEDLCVSLAEFRHYMEEFKGYELDNLTLVCINRTKVALYDQNGKYIMTTSGTKSAAGEYEVCLDDVYYIQFLGKGQVSSRLTLG